MRYYPLFLDLTDKEVLVAGAGEVGLRKIHSLLEANPARLTLIDPAMHPDELRARFAHPRLVLLPKGFEAEDIYGKNIVFAATARREVNSLIATLCRDRGILCNVADAPDEGNFIVPALVESGSLCITVSTQGQSPALARKLRLELEDWVGKRYTPLLTVMGRLRPLLLELGLPTKENTNLFRALVSSPLADYLQANDHAAASALLASLLPESLHRRMGELLHGI